MEKKSFKWYTPFKYIYDRYLIQAMGSMALGLFASLIIGLILSQIAKIPGLEFFGFGAEVLAASSPVVGAAIGVAIAHGLKASPLTMFSCAATGALGYQLGGPVGAYIAAVVSCEIGRFVAGKTKIDIVLTPMVVIIAGSLAAKFVGPGVNSFMTWLGSVVNAATIMAPIPMGIIIATVVGMALTAPISSAALCIMLNLSGLAAGAAAAGCCAQMIGFAVISFRENRWGGFFAQGIGTSMLQVPNIIRNPLIWIAPTLASAITGPLATCVFKLQMNGEAIASGMGTCGLVGQIGVYTGWVNDIASGAKAGITGMDWLGLILISFVLPAVLSLLFDFVLRKLNWVKDGDMKLDI